MDKGEIEMSAFTFLAIVWIIAWEIEYAATKAEGAL